MPNPNGEDPRMAKLPEEAVERLQRWFDQYDADQILEQIRRIESGEPRQSAEGSPVSDAGTGAILKEDPQGEPDDESSVSSPKAGQGARRGKVKGRQMPPFAPRITPTF